MPFSSISELVTSLDIVCPKVFTLAKADCFDLKVFDSFNKSFFVLFKMDISDVKLPSLFLFDKSSMTFWILLAFASKFLISFSKEILEFKFFIEFSTWWSLLLNSWVEFFNSVDFFEICSMPESNVP